MRAPLALALVATFALSGVARAQVDGVTIAHRDVVLDGHAFGDAGAYESLTGSIRFTIERAARTLNRFGHSSSGSTRNRLDRAGVR